MTDDKKITYSGVLGKKIPRDEAPSTADEWTNFLKPRLRLLLDHYEIARDDPNRWIELSMWLAVNHVPGFEYSPKGAPTKWGENEEFKLFSRVVELTKRGNSIRNACRLLAKKEPYKSHSQSMEVLRRRFYAAKKVMLTIVEKDMRSSVRNG